MPDDLTRRLTEWRRHLHAYPEISCQEGATAAFVCARLDEMGIPFSAGVGGHGVVATLRRGVSNRAVGLRADMDALPVLETPGRGHGSRNHGVMHACGHDGHTVSLLGAAAMLLEDTSWSGTVQCVFQPAEEGFGGAQAMLDDGLLARFPMERMFGYHNWPGLEAGVVMVHGGPVMAGAASFDITLRGVAGHAAMPQDCADPVQGVAQLIIALNAIVARNVDPQEAAVISTCMLKAGEAHNLIAQEAVLGGTMRAQTPGMMRFLQARVREVAEHVARGLQLSARVEIVSEVTATVNHAAEAAMAAKAAAGAGLSVRGDMRPSMAAEDFGRFLEVIPGAYAWIGNGASAGLHNEAYDFNDAILPVAARYYAAVARAALA